MLVFLIAHGRLSWRMWEKVKSPKVCPESEEFRPSLLPFRLFLVTMVKVQNSPVLSTAVPGWNPTSLLSWVHPFLMNWREWGQSSIFKDQSIWEELARFSPDSRPSFQSCPAEENWLLSSNILLVPLPCLCFGLTPEMLFIVDVAEGGQTLFPVPYLRPKLHCVYHKVTALPIPSRSHELLYQSSAFLLEDAVGLWDPVEILQVHTGRHAIEERAESSTSRSIGSSRRLWH